MVSMGDVSQGLNLFSQMQGMMGGGQQERGYQEEIYAPETEVGSGGFDLANYLPQYYNGGVPNDGKPAIIYDMKTNTPTGTMNELGAEKIVPAFSGEENAYSSVTVNPNTQVAQPRLDIGSQSPTSSMGRPDLYKGRVAMDLVNDEAKGKEFMGKYQTELFGSKGNTTKNPDTSIKKIVKREETAKEGDKGFLGMGNFGDSIRIAGRLYGHYVDAKRDNWGLGKGGMTRFLDSMDRMDAAKKTKPKSDKEKLAFYEEQKKIDKKYATKDEPGFEEKEAIKAKYRNKPKAKSDEDYQKEAYDQMQEDVKGGVIDEVYLDESGNVKADEYLADYIKFQKEGTKAQIKDVDTGKTTKWFGRGDPVYKREKTGEYTDVTGNKKAGEGLTASKVNKKTGQVLLSDGSIITLAEAKKKGLV